MCALLMAVVFPVPRSSMTICPFSVRSACFTSLAWFQRNFRAQFHSPLPISTRLEHNQRLSGAPRVRHAEPRSRTEKALSRTAVNIELHDRFRQCCRGTVSDAQGHPLEIDQPRERDDVL